MTRSENNIVLLSITICWASSYIFTKNLPISLSTYAFLTLTAVIASLIMLIVFAKRLKYINKSITIKGFILSLILTGTLITEKWGLDTLSSSNASFISSLAILFLPLMLMTMKVKISRNNGCGAMVILLGIWLTNGFSVSAFLNKGAAFMVISCIFTAIYTIAVDKFTKQEDPLLLGIVQMCFSAIVSFILWFLESPTTFFSIEYTDEMISSILIIAVFAKAYAYTALMYSQKHATPISVTVIASTEPVVTLMLALAIPSTHAVQEQFSTMALMGALVITVGAVVAGTSFLEPKTNVEQEVS